MPGAKTREAPTTHAVGKRQERLTFTSAEDACRGRAPANARPGGRGLAAVTPSTRAGGGASEAAGRTGPPPPTAGARACAQNRRARGAAARGPAAPRARAHAPMPPATSSRRARPAPPASRDTHPPPVATPARRPWEPGPREPSPRPPALTSRTTRERCASQVLATDRLPRLRPRRGARRERSSWGGVGTEPGRDRDYNPHKAAHRAAECRPSPRPPLRRPAGARRAPS